ncbi:hypothetical protein [Bacillus sp. TL12]|uniref:hypothetical protein n=1 Tax=Bacillus sp. TL12 TaxID=2894756 RepID=UPI001F524922|nr:hypothetical protein [Bacillus sp. TL12]MCI0768193.1 hypothetical protein [Bacillus sp. TL12]
MLNQVSVFLKLIILHHLLHVRWKFKQFFNNKIVISPQKITYMSCLIFLSLSALSFIIFLAFLNLLQGLNVNLKINEIQIIYFIFYTIIWYKSAFSKLNDSYIRTYFSSDFELISINTKQLNVSFIRLAKSIDTFFLSTVLIYIPMFLGLSLSLLYFTDINIPIKYYTVNLLLIVIFSLLTKCILVYLTHILRTINSNSTPTYSFLKLTAAILLGYFLSFIIFYNSSITNISKEIIINKFQFILDYIINSNLNIFYSLTQNGISFYITLVFLSLIYILFLTFNTNKYSVSPTHNKKNIVTSNKLSYYINNIQTNNIILAIISKDLILLSRKIYTTKSQIQFLTKIYGFLFGIGIYIKINDINLENIYFSSFIGISIVSSLILLVILNKTINIEAEGMMIQTLLIYLKDIKVLLKAKVLLSFCILLLFNTILLLIFLFICNFNVIEFLLTFINIIIISFTLSLIYNITNYIFPNFNWEDESKIGSSEKATIIEAIFIGIYLFFMPTIIGTINLYYAINKLTYLEMLTYISIGIITINILIIVVCFIILKKDWWKKWEI